IRSSSSPYTPLLGHAIVDGGGAAAAVMRVELGAPAGLLGTVEAQNANAAAVQVIQLGEGEVDCQGGTLGVVVGRRRLLGHRQERRVHHARPAVADDGGEPIGTAWSSTTIGEGRAESRAGGEARKSVLCGWDDLGSMNISCEGSYRAPRPGRANRRPSAALSCARGERRRKNAMRGVARGFEFGALLGERSGSVASVAGRRYWRYPEIGNRKSGQWRAIGSSGWRWC